MDGKYIGDEGVHSEVSSTLHLTPVVKGAARNGGLLQVVVGIVMIVAAVYPPLAPYAAAMISAGNRFGSRRCGTANKDAKS